MKGKPAGFALVDLLMTVAVSVVLLSLAVPALSRARELSKRSVCSVNLAGIGATAKIYSASNKEQWMVPPFKQSAIDREGIDYGADTGTATDPGTVGDPAERRYQSTSETENDPNGSTTVSSTRAYWLLVRSGDITVKQFICPSSGDTDDPTENLELYYDFESYNNISYGYQVPFGPRDTQPREGMDNRQITAADKGPFYKPIQNVDWDAAADDRSLDVNDSPKNWRRFNSASHGGIGNGEGQNALYADGHASFIRIPAGGIDNDNIYTLIDGQNWANVDGKGRIHGLTPHEASNWPYPGQNAFGTGAGRHSSTDSLIYP